MPKKRPRPYHIWLISEVTYLKENYGYIPIEQIMAHLGVSFASVQKAAIRFNAPGKLERVDWTPEEDEVLLNMYPCNLQDIAKALNRKYNSVNSRIRVLGIERQRSWRVWRDWEPEETEIVEDLKHETIPTILPIVNKLCKTKGWDARTYESVGYKLKQVRRKHGIKGRKNDRNY